MSDSRRFMDALLRAMPPTERNQVKNILVIGPGRDDPLARLLAELGEARLTAIDLDSDSITRLRELHAESLQRLDLITGDAADPEELPRGPYDLVIIRHPDIARSMEVWQKILTLALGRLHSGGLLVVSLYSLPEIAFVDQVVGALDADIVPGSPYTAVPVPLQGTDRYILIARKR